MCGYSCGGNGSSFFFPSVIVIMLLFILDMSFEYINGGGLIFHFKFLFNFGYNGNFM